MSWNAGMRKGLEAKALARKLMANRKFREGKKIKF